MREVWKHIKGLIFGGHIMSHNFKDILGNGVLAKVLLWHGHLENRQEGKPIDIFFTHAHMFYRQKHWHVYCHI